MSWLSDLMSDASGNLNRAAQGVTISVNQDNVMQAARLVQAEAEYFRSRVDTWADDMRVEPMGGDPVSSEVARVLNLKLRDAPDSYVNRCREYADMLEGLAKQLGESAKTYGFTEEQVRSQFAAASQDAEVRQTPIDRGGGLRDV